MEKTLLRWVIDGWEQFTGVDVDGGSIASFSIIRHEHGRSGRMCRGFERRRGEEEEDTA